MCAAPMLALADTPLQIAPERPADAAAVERVVARAFGPGRFAKSSYRVREHARFRPELSFVARQGGTVVGTVRLWSICIGAAEALFLGPIAVDQDVRSEGVGGQLVEAALEAAARAGERAVLLIGDLGYFARFAFVQALDVALPGPADPRRVLVRVLAGEAPQGAVSGPPAPTPAPAARPAPRPAARAG